jgi:hypothetical protein
MSKRPLLLGFLLISSVLSVSSVVASAAATRDQVPPILLAGENGTLGVDVYLGTTSSTMNIPQMGVMPVQVCDGADCEIYSANYMSNAEGYSMHRWVSTQITIGERFSKRPVTVQVANDFTDSSKGWSAVSNATTGWSDSDAWYRVQESRPLIEIMFETIDSTSISKIDVCSNYKPGVTIKSQVSRSYDLNLDGYTSAKFELFENGVVKQTKDFPNGTSLGMGECGGNSFSAFSRTQFSSLTPGKIYSLKFSISGAGKADLGAILDFVTPGACPTGPIPQPASPRAFYYGAMDSNGILQSYLMTGVARWRLADLIPKRLGPIYFSASKVGPYNGQLLKIRDSAEKWKYLADKDDWALVVENASATPAADVLANTVFSNCTGAQLKPTVVLDEAKAPANDQACTVVNNEVVPTKEGLCFVKVSVENPNATAFGVRSQSVSNTVPMNYFITSVSTATTTTTAPPSTTSSPKSAVRKCSFQLTKAKSSVTFSKLLGCTGLKKSTKQKMSVAIAASSRSVCRQTGTAVIRKKKGNCVVTVRVTTGKKVANSRKVTVTAR